MAFSLATYQTFLGNVDDAISNQEKGRSLENLIEYLMQSIPGVRVIGKDANCGDEELDLILFNSQTHPNLKPWSSIILIECKNWSNAIDGHEISWFLRKMEERKVENGIFVAVNGVTGDFRGNRGGKRFIIDALSRRIRVIVLTREDLDRITSVNDLCEILLDKYCKLFLGKVI